MATISSIIKSSYARQAITAPRKPAFHVQKPKIKIAFESKPVVHINKGTKIDIKA